MPAAAPPPIPIVPPPTAAELPSVVTLPSQFFEHFFVNLI